MSKKILTTPIKAEDIENLKAGDIVYLNGYITTCRDVAHRRVIEQNMSLPIDIKDGAILHAGPIVKKIGDKYHIISIGPTTSMRMEKYEYDFVEKTGVRLIVGKGGMGAKTSAACRDFKALHLVYPAGNAVLAATQVEDITEYNWFELGMPETLWTCKVNEFGPLIVSIDTQGNNWFEQKKCEYNETKEQVLADICQQVKFIK